MIHKKQHGHRPRGKHSPTYISWKSMKQRCQEKPEYVGISYDPRWEDFRLFLEDMGERPDGTTLDRIDNAKGYSKENCRWATPSEQASNRRSNHLLQFAGLELTITEWSELLGWSPGVIQKRIRTGWSVERAITTPRRVYDVQKQYEEAPQH